MARTRLTLRRPVCGVLAILVSLLSFAGVLQAGRHGRPGDTGAGAQAHLTSSIRLVDICDLDQARAGAVVEQPLVPKLPATVPLGVAPEVAPEVVPAVVTEAPLAVAPELSPELLPQMLPEVVQGFEAAASEALQGDAQTVLYVPVTELSERPLLVQDIDAELDLASAGIIVPDGMMDRQAIGILLINAQGGVDRLQFESADLPRYLEAMLAQRFAEARFLPGKIDGRPVRSALRIALQLR